MRQRGARQRHGHGASLRERRGIEPIDDFGRLGKAALHPGHHIADDIGTHLQPAVTELLGEHRGEQRVIGGGDGDLRRRGEPRLEVGERDRPLCRRGARHQQQRAFSGAIPGVEQCFVIAVCAAEIVDDVGVRLAREDAREMALAGALRSDKQRDGARPVGPSVEIGDSMRVGVGHEEIALAVRRPVGERQGDLAHGGGAASVR